MGLTGKVTRVWGWKVNLLPSIETASELTVLAWESKEQGVKGLKDTTKFQQLGWGWNGAQGVKELES